MTRSPVDHAAPTSSDEEVGSAAQTPGSAAGESDVASVEAAAATAAADADDDDGDEVLPFGEQPATRFAADVEYRGRADGHHYVVRVRHRLLDSTFTVAIDGIEHDPKAEEKARKARTAKGKDESEDDAEPSEQGEDADPSDSEPDPSDDSAPDSPSDRSVPDDADPSDRSVPDDGLRFRLEDGFSTLHCTVRRRSEEGELEDAEVITIRTAGLGGAGEVEVRHGLRTTPLVPADGSPSAARDEKRTAHPTRYALIAALTKAATFLLPLLGIGALFSGLLDPVKEWIAERIRPVIEAIGQVVRPIRDWLDEVTAPVRDFLDTLLAPVRELIAAILRPIGEALRWLLGLLPDIGLPFSVPDWLVDVLVPVVVVVAVFVATFSRLRHRREKLAETASGARAATASDTSAAGDEARSAGESSAQN